MDHWGIVVVCHMRDIDMLRLQARSLAVFMPAELVGQILVIENDADGEVFAAAFASQVLPEYGLLAAHVTLIRREELAPGISFAHGWRSQQVLKMLATARIATEHVLILDAKNHFIRPLTRSSYIAEDGRLRSYAVSQRGHLAQLFANSHAAFGLDPEPYFDRNLPNITPFPARPATIRGMITKIEHHHAMTFAAFFLGRDVAEFYLLSAFLVARDGGPEREYSLGEPDVITVFPDKAEAGAFEWVDFQLHRDAILCMGVHWAAIPLLSPAVRDRIVAFWQERGLVRDAKEGLSFLAAA